MRCNGLRRMATRFPTWTSTGSSWLPRRWVSALLAAAREKGVKLDWVSFGLCVDERGAAESVEGVRHSTSSEFWSMADSSDNALVILTN